MKEYSLEYLNSIKERHSKMDNLIYPELKLQKYLKSPNTTVQAAKTLFKWRTRSAMFKMNYGKMYVDTACPFCSVEPDSQSHSFQCHEVKKKIDIEGDYKIREEIFD